MNHESSWCETIMFLHDVLSPLPSLRKQDRQTNPFPIFRFSMLFELQLEHVTAKEEEERKAAKNDFDKNQTCFSPENMCLELIPPLNWPFVWCVARSFALSLLTCTTSNGKKYPYERTYIKFKSYYSMNIMFHLFLLSHLIVCQDTGCCEFCEEC